MSRHSRIAKQVALTYRIAGMFKAMPAMVEKVEEWAVGHYAGALLHKVEEQRDALPAYRDLQVRERDVENDFLRLEDGESVRYPSFSPFTKSFVYYKVENQGGKYKMSAVDAQGRPAAGMSLSGGPDTVLDGLMGQINAGLEMLSEQRTDLKKIGQYVKKQGAFRNSELVGSHSAQKIFETDLRGWPYMQSFDAVAEKLNEKVVRVNEQLDVLSEGRNDKVLVPGDVFYSAGGNDKVDFEFIASEDSYLMDTDDIDQLYLDEFDSSEASRILEAGDWSNISVVIEMSGGRSDVKGTWQDAFRKLYLKVRPTPMSLSSVKSDVQSLKNTVEHELMHMAQDFLDWITNYEAVRPGRPSKNILPDRTLQEIKDSMNPGRIDRDEYHSRPNEFYPWLSNLVNEFRQARKPPFTPQDAREFILNDDTFQRWKRNNPDLWEKGVTEFVKAAT